MNPTAYLVVALLARDRR